MLNCLLFKWLPRSTVSIIKGYTFLTGTFTLKMSCFAFCNTGETLNITAAGCFLSADPHNQGSTSIISNAVSQESELSYNMSHDMAQFSHDQTATLIQLHRIYVRQKERAEFFSFKDGDRFLSVIWQLWVTWRRDVCATTGICSNVSRHFCNNLWCFQRININCDCYKIFYTLSIQTNTKGGKAALKLSHLYLCDYK